MDIMVNSGTATHVCPPWFAPDTPLYPLQHGQGPRLRTATDEVIHVHGYKWVYMHNTNKQTLVVLFYACDVTQPIMSVTRLAEQGFTTQPNETSTITHTHQGIQLSIEATRRPLLLASCIGNTANQHEA